ncbi:hypothetical protein JVU11DRAFT_6830 [Chiua virens]|nr:hypothetical protein JVU11DRAFT_6830 [Chiua virens]
MSTSQRVPTAPHAFGSACENHNWNSGKFAILSTASGPVWESLSKGYSGKSTAARRNASQPRSSCRLTRERHRSRNFSFNISLLSIHFRLTMVQISPLLYVIPVISHASLSSSTPGGSGLAVRQSPGNDTGDLPPACQSSCEVINTLSNCATTSCKCTTSIGSQFQDCANCLVSSTPSVESSAQSAIDNWNQACNGNLKLSGSSGSSSSGSNSGSSTTNANSPSSTGLGATKSGGALGTGNMAACVVVLFGIATAFLYF